MRRRKIIDTPIAFIDDSKILDYIDHPLSGLMSRSGSFPLSVAVALLKKHASPGCIVVDPFCGRGTTLLAARILGMRGYGADVAPEAVVCSKAKLADVDPLGIRDYISQLKLRRRSVTNIPDNVSIFFHPATMSQILCVRDQLLGDASSAEPIMRSHGIFTLAVLLGILHGHAKYSLSVSSSHAYAMAPGYVKQYARKHRLKPESKDVRACLLEKALRCLQVPLPTPLDGVVIRGSAENICNLLPRLKHKADVILTSPPYLNAQTYCKDNWLRIWLLGEDYRQISNNYIQTGSVRRYEVAMRSVFRQFDQLLKPNGQLICIAGDVRLKRTNKGQVKFDTFRTGHFLAEICCDNASGFRLQEITEHHVASNSRYLHALSQSNGHSTRDRVETVFIAQKTGRK